jgi:protocatechuate 3,4-dioxygenase, alpha subunit
MKLIPTASQTVGPFFSIGLAPLYQNTATVNSANTVTINGTVFDGDEKPIPDAVLEFWNARNFVRVPTSEEGRFSVTLEAPPKQDAQSGRQSIDYFDVLVFMRGLLKPVHTRVYLGDPDAGKNDPALEAVPTSRIATLIPKSTEAQNRYVWDIFMQGEDETVFFDY